MVATERYYNNTLYNLNTATQGNSSHKPTSAFQVDFCLSCTSDVIWCFGEKKILKSPANISLKWKYVSWVTKVISHL